MEKVILTTRFLAHNDYLNDTNSVGINYTLTPCIGAGAPLYDSYQMWAKPDMESYINKLREVYALCRLHKEKAKALGVEARKTIESKFDININTDYLASKIREAQSVTNGKAEPKIYIKELA